MKEFVDNVKVLINALGYKVLEPFAHKDSSTATVDDGLFYITSGSVNATGKVTTEGFVVFAGATVNEKMSVKSLSTGMPKQRQKLFDSSKVDGEVTTEDILFRVHRQLQISFSVTVLVVLELGKAKLVEL